MGLAALLGKGVYSFGQLLQHPIARALEAGSFGWLHDLLTAFNAGGWRVHGGGVGTWIAFVMGLSYSAGGRRWCACSDITARQLRSPAMVCAVGVRCGGLGVGRGWGWWPERSVPACSLDNVMCE